MIDTVQTSKKAIELRRSGFSYSDIAKQLKVSKTSVSNWVKKVRLTEQEKVTLQKNLQGKMNRGRMMASITLRSRKVFKEKVIYEKAEKDFATFAKDPLFSIGLGLVWVNALKGGSSNFQFTSSDPATIKFIINWVGKYLNLPKKAIHFRLFIDSSYKNKGIEEIWVKSMGLPSDSMEKTTYLASKGSRKDKEYKGSLAITISKIEVIRRLIAWQKLAIRYYG